MDTNLQETPVEEVELKVAAVCSAVKEVPVVVVGKLGASAAWEVTVAMQVAPARVAVALANGCSSHAGAGSLQGMGKSGGRY